MSFGDDYNAGYTGNYGTNVDTFSYSFQMGQKDRERDMRKGTYGSSGGDGMAGAGAGDGRQPRGRPAPESRAVQILARADRGESGKSKEDF